MAKINKLLTSETGHQVTGKVAILYGTVKAISPDGTVRLLKLNSPVFADDRIIIGDDGSVSIVFNTFPPTQLDLGRLSDVFIDEDVYGGVSPDVLAEATAQQEAIQEALLAGDQPVELDATAAGGEENSGGGHPVFIVNPDWVEITPESGAETRGVTWGAAIEETYALNAEESQENPSTVVPTAHPDSNETREGMEGSEFATEGNVLDNDLPGDGSITVTAVDGSPHNVGVPITTDLGGTIIIDSDGSYSYTPPPQVDHSQGPVYDVIDYTITNSDGNSASSTLTINVLDTEPIAVADTDTATEGQTLNSLVGVLDNDTMSADVPGTVVGLAVGDTGTNSTGTMTVAGTYGTLTIAADGSYSYVANASVDAGSQDVFTYTMQDADGDPSHATLTITFEGDNNAPTAQDSAADIYESGLRADGTETVGGTVTFDPGLDAPATLTYDTSTLVYGTATFNTNTGAWTYTLTNPVTDGAGPETDSFTYTVTDSDGSTSTGTITITIIDDVPTAVADTGTATEGGTLTVPQATGVLVNDTIGADAPGTVVGLAAGDTGTNSTGTMTVAGTYGTLTIAADGSYSYVANASVDAGSQDVFTYTMQDADGDPSHATLTITFEGDNNAPTAQDGAASQNDAAWYAGTQTASEGTLAFDMGGDTPGSVSMVYDGGLGAATKVSAGGVTTFTASHWVLTINETTGAYSFSQTGAYMHDSGADSDNGKVTVTLTDSDGSTKIAVLDLTIDDMGPTAISPSGAYLLNEASQSFTGKLDFGDGNIEDNIGADQPGTVYFAGVPTAALTSGGLPVQYEISADGMTLRGYTAAGDVFTVTLNPDASGQDTYTINMIGTIDGGATSIDYSGVGAYEFVGGNGAWAGFNTVDKKGVDTDPDSNDLLLTPINAGTVNTTANAGGVDNPFVDFGEGMRVDFVIDLTGNPQGHPYTTPTNQDHAFDGHYTVNGAGALFAACANASVKITARDDADTGHVPGTVGTVGDGTQDHINAIGISYGGAFALVSYAIAGTTPYDIDLGGNTFTITFNADGTAQVDGVAENTVITTFTADGYNSIEYMCVGEDNFQIGDFGTSVIEAGIPVEFSVPVEIMDQDGDTASGTIDVLLLPENTLYDPAYAMSGTAGADVLTGDGHDNLIYGGQGDDIISGGEGDDIVIGGTGSNTLSGGLGADTFIISEGAQDTILDYSKLQGDKVDISSVLNEGAGDYLSVVANTDGKAELRVLDSSDTVKASISFETINYSDLNDMGAGNELDSLLDKVAIDH